MTTHYNPQPHLDTFTRGSLKNIADAYAVAGLDVPARNGERVASLVTNHPTAADVARDLATVAHAATDPQAWLEDAVTRLDRAMALDLLRHNLAAAVRTTSRTGLSDAIDQAASDLRAHFDSTVTNLTKAAGKLPDGWGALDLRANVVDHTSRALEAAVAALNHLGTLASIYPVRGPKSGKLSLKATLALRVLDVPSVPVEEVDQHTGDPLNAPDPTRDTLRRFIADVNEHGLDPVLVNAARGGYGDAVTFALPIDTADLTARIERLSEAARQEYVRNGAATRRWERVSVR